MFCLSTGWIIVFAIIIFIIAFILGLAIGLWKGYDIRGDVESNKYARRCH